MKITPSMPTHAPARAAAIRAAAILVAGMLAAALAPSMADAQQVARLVAEPAAITVVRGEATPIRVTAYDAAGNALPGRPYRMVASRRSLGVEDGSVEGREVGEWTLYVIATDGGQARLEVPVTVTWPAVTRAAIAPADGSLYRGATLAHDAVAFHADGSERPEPDFTWRSSDPDVATVDAFGNVTGTGTGTVTITAEFGGAEASIRHSVAPFPESTLELRQVHPAGALGRDGIRTGDVFELEATVRAADGREISDVPVAWSLAYEPTAGIIAPAAPGQVDDGRFVADVPGIYTLVASAGPLTARRSVRVRPRDVVRGLEVMGQGRQDRIRTTDFWVFEGVDGRDYVITGSKRADGHAYVFDVTDPANIVKTDSVQVDARAVNDVKVSPDARYATLTREGASDRRNGVVILDLADPAHPVIASEFTDGLTGGVHNAFPTNDHVFALSAGDKYLILDVRDIYDPRYVSEYDHPESSVHDVWVHDGIAYSAEWGTGVVMVDVGNGRWGGSIERPALIGTYPLPSGATHAAFPYRSESTGRMLLFVGDEIMSRRGLALEQDYGGSYVVPYDPETGTNGIPVSTRGYIQVIDLTDPEQPQMVARYEVTEYGTHNIWVENDILYQAYYEGGLRVVDVSGELMGNLYTQGREIAAFKPFDPAGYIPNSPMVWSAMPHKGMIFFSDTNSGIWAVRLEPRGKPAT